MLLSLAASPLDHWNSLGRQGTTQGYIHAFPAFHSTLHVCILNYLNIATVDYLIDDWNSLARFGKASWLCTSPFCCLTMMHQLPLLKPAIRNATPSIAPFVHHWRFQCNDESIMHWWPYKFTGLCFSLHLLVFLVIYNVPESRYNTCRIIFFRCIKWLGTWNEQFLWEQSALLKCQVTSLSFEWRMFRRTASTLRSTLCCGSDSLDRAALKCVCESR